MMMNNNGPKLLDKPNVLFLSVDALRADRMSLYGYHRSTTPNLDAMAKNAIVCRRASSVAAFTQASFPSLMTSSHPLSFGGYDNGAVGRPKTVFATFSEHGYRVTLLSTFKWVSKFFGYGEGVETEAHLFTPQHLSGAALNRMKSSVEGYLAGQGSSEDMLSIVRPVMKELVEQVDEFCIERQRQLPIDRLDFSDTGLVRANHNYGRVRRVMARHWRAFENDPLVYIQKHFDPIPRSHEWIWREWRYCRTPWGLVRLIVGRAINRVIGLFSPSLESLRNNRFKQFVDGQALANRVIRTINEHEGEQPFLIWTHFLDTHVPYIPGSGPNWFKHVGEYLERLGYPPDIDPAIALNGFPRTDHEREAWSALYDACVLYVDEQIGRIMGALETSGKKDNTLIVFCADHGEELCEHGNISHYFRLYDHNVQVPMVFYHPHLKGRQIDSLTTLMDLAPTMADLAGVSPPLDWKGKPVTDDEVSKRDHLILETFYGGNCVFPQRPLYMAVRTDRYKYIWKEYRDPTDTFGPDGNELFDISEDPLEQNNIYRPDHPLINGFNALIASRLSEIPEVSEDRISALLAGSTGAPRSTTPIEKTVSALGDEEILALDRQVGPSE